ncbi:hypothetical protein [Phocaeicola plebeius]|jgi:hypothetical protein|uniref:hypothetical protein n=1 Tax=Phocaeicola plebeius TaxID=310297 RepID=UPI003F949320
MTKNKSNALSKLLTGFIIIIGVGLYINSVLKDWDVEQDLGSNYILCADGEILYQSGDEKPVEYVIPFGTTKYGFNERWIVVETKTHLGFHQTLSQDTITGEVCNYWIIDKSIPVDINAPSTFEDIYYQDNAYSIVRKSLIGPLDSLGYKKEISKRSIKVIWHEKK